MNSNELAIDLKGVEKVYSRKVFALRGVEMQVRKGEVFGLLGPNGAGKSTLVKIIMTVVRATRAQGQVLGAPVGDKATLARIGYLPENHRFPRYLTGRQVLDFFAALSGLPRAARKSRAGELLEIVGMSAWADHKIVAYSKGMMQRIGLAQAMMHNPDLILLDEPTDGVDPVGRKDIRDVLVRLKDKGTSVLINSHLLSELEMISDRVAIIVGGNVAKQGTLEELSLGRGHFEIAVDGALSAEVRNKLPSNASFRPEGIRVDSVEALDVQPVIDTLRQNGVTIRSLKLIRPTLEELFMEAVMQQTGGGPYAAGAAIPKRGFEVGVK